MDDIGVRGGEDDICRDEDGGVQRGGRSTRAETASTDYGRRWRDEHRDDILTKPKIGTTEYNHVLQKIFSFCSVNYIV